MTTNILIFITSFSMLYYIKFNNGEKQSLLIELIRMYYFKLFLQIKLNNYKNNQHIFSDIQ